MRNIQLILMGASLKRLIHDMAPPRAPFVSIAPLMGISHGYFHYLCRLLTRTSLLHTEMVVDRAVLRNSHLRGIWRVPGVQQLHVQLGGHEASDLLGGARVCEAMGFEGININCGCPSPKVAGAGCFGAVTC